MPLFKAVKLAECYDIAIMSTKGLSVTAARSLVDHLCAEGSGVPLLVLHDFDKPGFSILGTLQRDTRRYEFSNPVEVIDLGLRLEDVEEHNLESEAVVAKHSWQSNLLENGATEVEAAFLCGGQRVELNAFTSDQLVAWIKDKLERVGVRKVVPRRECLAIAFRQALTRALLQEELERARGRIDARVQRRKLPRALVREVKNRLESSPEVPWDEVINGLARESANGGT